MLVIILAGALLGGTALLIAGNRREPKRVRVAPDNRNSRRRR